MRHVHTVPHRDILHLRVVRYCAGARQRGEKSLRVQSTLYTILRTTMIPHRMIVFSTYSTPEYMSAPTLYPPQHPSPSSSKYTRRVLHSSPATTPHGLQHFPSLDRLALAGERSRVIRVAVTSPSHKGFLLRTLRQPTPVLLGSYPDLRGC